MADTKVTRPETDNTKPNTSPTNGGNGKQKESDNDIPEGFDTRVGREQGVGWLMKGPGVTVSGRVIGRFEMKGKDDDGNRRAFYQIRVNDIAGVYKDGKRVGDLKATTKNPDDKEENMEVMVVKGMILNIGEHKALEDLQPFTCDGGVYDVWFRYLAEEKIPNSRNTYWRLKGPMMKTLKPATHRPSKRRDEEQEIPF